MQSFKAKNSKTDGPEAKIQRAILAALKAMDWMAISTHGNEYQMGFPDVYAAHREHGVRWIECKNPDAFTFTNAQMEMFPQFTAKGVGIWILVSDDPAELQKLFGPANWYLYLPVFRSTRRT